MNHTQFREKRLWNKYEEVKWYGFECVAICKLYIKDVHELEVRQFWGSAISWRNNTSNTFLEKDRKRVENIYWDPTNYPKQWDIVFWASTKTNKYGHVAIVDNTDWITLDVIEQNGEMWSSTGNWWDAIRIHTYSYRDVLGRYTPVWFTVTPLENLWEWYTLLEKKIRNGENGEKFATREEVAIMIERNNIVRDVRVLEWTWTPLDRTNVPDWAIDNGKTMEVVKNMSFVRMRELFWVNKYSYIDIVRENKSLQLSQDEFKKKSSWCTMYAHFANYLNQTGKNISKKDRKRCIDRMIENWPLWENNGANTMEVAELWFDCLNALWLHTWGSTYFFEAGSIEMNYVIKALWHGFVWSFVISKNFSEDRINDFIINEDIHWGKTYWWHAIAYSDMYGKAIFVANSYIGNTPNHWVVPRESYNERFNKKRDAYNTYSRELVALHIY